MRLLFYIPSIASGGAERVTVLICNELSNRGHSVIIATNTFKPIKYEISKKIAILSIYPENHFEKYKSLRWFRVIKLIRSVSKSVKPDVIISILPFMYLYVLISTIGLRIPIIASDHTSFVRKLPWFESFIRFKLYNFAKVVTILSYSDFKFLGSRLPRKVVMPNPISYPIYKGEHKRKKIILAVGRLDVWELKGFDLLITVWSRIADRFPDWNLNIAGEGSEKSLLELNILVEKLNVYNRVSFLGFHSDIDKIMRDSSIFVLSSRVEGFGLVLVEAMSQGCACISFDSEGRQKEIITSQESGILIDNHNDLLSLENALITLIENESLRVKLSTFARKEVERFSIDKIVDRWENILIKVKKKY